MKIPFLYLTTNRFLIVILALCGLSLLKILPEGSMQRGNSPIFFVYQGDHVYTYTEPKNPLIAMWAVWDTKWYVSIAEDGYSTQREPYTRTDNKGFLPLYALLLYIVSTVLTPGNAFLAGMIVSNALLIASLFMLRRLIGSEMSLEGKVESGDAMLYLILFPTSYYLSAIYPESLFLFLSILVFYLVRMRKIALACLVFSLACITKTFGIFLFIPLLLHLWEHRSEISILRMIGYGAIACIVPLLYCAYMYCISGDPLAYIHIQEIFFSHSWTNPLEIILVPLLVPSFYSLWSLAFVVFGLWAMIRSLGKIPLAYSLYGFACILFTPATGILDGSSRYLASLFVLPIALAAVIRQEKLKYVTLTIFAMIQGFAIFWWVIGATFAS